MNDATFLRNLAQSGQVALLADGTGVPAPQSVLDNEDRAGSAFVIDLVSPEAIESGDGRKFKAGTISVRDLPIPLMWQFQLNDGHKGAVIVGRIDYIEETPKGLGNARGVFDNGPWGREAERLVRNKMLRGVSGDYTNFEAQVLPDPEKESAPAESADGEGDSLAEVLKKDDEIKDDKILVTQSRLVSATLVSKPAFEGCYIHLADGAPDADPDDSEYEDGEISAPVTPAMLLAAGITELSPRLTQLEEVRTQELREFASAARERVDRHLLEKERGALVQRIRAQRNVTAGFGEKLSHGFLSAKAKAQPRDKNGRFIEIGAIVHWKSDSTPGGGWNRGKVEALDHNTGLYKIKSLDGTGQEFHVPGKQLEVVKALIPSTPSEAHQLTAKVDSPSLDTTPQEKESVFSMLKDGASLMRKPAPNEHPNDGWMSREQLGQQLFNKLHKPKETWDKNGEKYMRAGDVLRSIRKNKTFPSGLGGRLDHSYSTSAPAAPDHKPSTPKAPKAPKEKAQAPNDSWFWNKFDQTVQEAAPSAPEAPSAPAAPAAPAVPVRTPTYTPNAQQSAELARVYGTPAEVNKAVQSATGWTHGNSQLVQKLAAEAPNGSLSDVARVLYEHATRFSDSPPSWNSVDQSSWLARAQKLMTSLNK